MRTLIFLLLFSNVFPAINFILTIDDAPSKYTTPIAKVLLSRNIQAIWFICGSKEHLKSHKKHTDFLVTNNFIFGNHSTSHNYEWFRYNYIDEIKKDFKQINDYFIDNYNIKLKYFRAPYGITTQYMQIAIEELDLKTMAWHLDFDDYNKTNFTTNEILCQFDLTIRTNRSEYIMLIHANKQCYEYLDFIIEETKRRGEFLDLKKRGL
jgi:peptidoglycan/xylan/chitin deacetylase (PgdA/CDA1 family)